MGNFKQNDRLMQFSSPLGKDVLLIETFSGAEGISRLFEFHVELLAEVGTEIDPKKLIGSKVAVAIGLNDVQGSRWVSGVVASFEQASGDTEFDVYRARIVPSMWQMTLSANCRVFQSLTVMEIVKKVIGEYGLTLSDQTTASYPKLEYCTQYDETDFHFVSRILEQHGIFYWFEHTDQDNKICFGDGRSAYADCPLSASVAYGPQGGGREGAYGAWVTEFSATATMVSGKHSTQDYDYRTYDVHDVDSEKSASPYGKNGFEDFFYPAGEEGYAKGDETKLSAPDLGKIFLGARAQASDAMAEVFRGTSNLRSMCGGYTFSLSKHPRKPWNSKYLLTEVIHHATQVPPYRSEDSGAGAGYGNRFTAVSAEIVYKPLAVTPKPRIFGPQTAFVVAPAGDEIYLDKLGRVCVQFYWDRLRKKGSTDSTWVRVAQSWAGNGWGTYFWPRLMDEVVVQFLNGDPDNPVVTGSVYNGVNVPKYELPEMSTRTGILTRSSKGGSAQNANELRFEDKMGSEQIFLNAEKDMDHRIEKDQRTFVGGNDSLIVTGGQAESVGGDYGLNVSGNRAEKIGANAGLEVGTDLSEKVGQNYSLKVGQNHGEKVGQNYSVDAGMELYLKAGMSLVIESGMEITLKGAGGFINIGPAGIAISGTLVLINSGGAAGSGSPATLTDPAAPKKPDEADDGSKGGKMG